VSTPLDRPFAVLATSNCPAYDQMLVALEREFRAVDREAVAEALDGLARPLFGLAEAPPNERVVALARAAWAALPHEGSAPPHWLLTCALDERHANGAVRAALAAEIGRRAGVPAGPVRLRGCWAVHIPDGGAHIAADLGPDAGRETADILSGGVCAHDLAFAVLTGLASAWRMAGDPERARRACGLRLPLPLGEDLRSLVQREVRAQGREA